MKTKAFLKEKLQEKTKEFKYLLEKTSIEIALFAVLWAGIAWYNQYNNESRRADKIPLAFSEIGQIERDAAREWRKIWPIAAYSMRLNDMCMKIFEAYNHSRYTFVPSYETKKFSSELYDARDFRHIYKYNLHDLVDTLPSYIPQVQQHLSTYKTALTQLTPANHNMEKSRDEDHDDQYRTETKTRTTYDKDGNPNGTETYTEQVYDHTIHTYDYNKKQGELGAKQLNALFAEIPVLQLNEQIKTTSQTNADGEYAAERSREIWPGNRLTVEQLLEIANTWFSWSTIMSNTNNISKLYPQLHTQTKQRNMDKKTAQSDRYTTYSSSDNGPREFQTAKNTANVGKQIENSINEILASIQLTQDKIPILAEKIKAFSGADLDAYVTSERESKQLEEEILMITKEIYQANFKEGVNVDRFRRGMVFLFGLIGLIAGGVVWAGIDYIGQRTPLYQKIFWQKK